MADPKAPAQPAQPARQQPPAAPGQRAQKQEKLADDGEKAIKSPEAAETVPPPGPVSKLYRAISNIAFFVLLGLFLGMVGMTALALDFLDLLQWRYRVPEEWRAKWPIAAYYDFVRLHQLPEEQRYQELLQREKQRYDEIIGSGSLDLRHRSESLEASYRELVRSQEEQYRKRQEELRTQQEDLLKERKALDDQKADLATRKEAVDLISQQLASEAANLEESMIKFTEDENRLKPIQDIAAAMEPAAMARILDEVSDNSLVFQILKGVTPAQSAAILAAMDPEKVGKIMKISQNPPLLPTGTDRSYIPQSLQNLVATSQANLR